MLKNSLLAFIPIFIAVDALGVLPIYLSITDGLTREEKNRIISQSILTAFCLATFFIFLGKAIFNFLGISIADFMIAGGIILFSIALADVMSAVKKRRLPLKEIAAVPLGTPLIVGPAVLTTSLIIISEYGVYPTLLSVLANVILAGLIFYFADFLIKLLGNNGAKALSKVTSLLLAAIAVMMIRKGIFEIFIK